MLQMQVLNALIDDLEQMVTGTFATFSFFASQGKEGCENDEFAFNLATCVLVKDYINTTKQEIQDDDYELVLTLSSEDGLTYRDILFALAETYVAQLEKDCLMSLIEEFTYVHEMNLNEDVYEHVFEDAVSIIREAIKAATQYVPDFVPATSDRSFPAAKLH